MRNVRPDLTMRAIDQLIDLRGDTASIAGRARSTTGIPPASSRCLTQYATVL
jgi:hypothetical protein